MNTFSNLARLLWTSHEMSHIWKEIFPHPLCEQIQPVDGSGFNPRHPFAQVATSVGARVLNGVKGEMHSVAIPFSDPYLVGTWTVTKRFGKASQKKNPILGFRGLCKNTQRVTLPQMPACPTCTSARLSPTQSRSAQISLPRIRVQSPGR